jgi:DNA-binding MarR family transcriptional regulator
MEQDAPYWTHIALPALMRHARMTYGNAMIRANAEAGCDDIPRNGIYVIGAMARDESPLSEIIRGLGVSKQSAGQLVDTLVLRGYLEREVDPNDRRRLTVTLTEHGRAAAEAQRGAVDRIDAALIAQVGEEKVMHAREVLAALIEMSREEQADE